MLGKSKDEDKKVEKKVESKVEKKAKQLTPMENKIKELEDFIDSNKGKNSSLGTAGKAVLKERKSFLSFLKTL